MKAMIMAAGRGVRMRPLTDTVPKPLLKVGGKALIDWHLEKLAHAGFTEVVINVSYLAEKIVAHVGHGEQCSNRYGVRIAWSHEPVALETGGGIATARPLLGDSWFALISADVFSDIDYRLLVERGRALQGQQSHLQLVPRRPGLIGEYRLDGGMLQFADPNDETASRYTWASLGVFRVAAFDGMPRNEPFVLLPHFRRWSEQGLMTGAVHEGVWENLGTVQEFENLVRRMDVN
jgi:MurNAc alpha-1-phosphate uridylyltransferase